MGSPLRYGYPVVSLGTPKINQLLWSKWGQAEKALTWRRGISQWRRVIFCGLRGVGMKIEDRQMVDGDIWSAIMKNLDIEIIESATAWDTKQATYRTLRLVQLWWYSTFCWARGMVVHAGTMFGTCGDQGSRALTHPHTAKASKLRTTIWVAAF